MSKLTFFASLAPAERDAFLAEVAAVSGDWAREFQLILTAPDSDPEGDYDEEGNFVGQVDAYMVSLPIVRQSELNIIEPIIAKYTTAQLRKQSPQELITGNPHRTPDAFAADVLTRIAGKKFGAVGSARTSKDAVTEQGGSNFEWEDFVPTGMTETDNSFDISVGGIYTVKCSWNVEYINQSGGPPVALMKNNATLEILGTDPGEWENTYQFGPGDRITLGLRAAPPGREIHYEGTLEVVWFSPS